MQQLLNLGLVEVGFSNHNRAQVDLLLRRLAVELFAHGAHAFKADFEWILRDEGIDDAGFQIGFQAFARIEGDQADLPGQSGGRKLGQLLNGKGSVALIAHAPGSASTMDRERGFKDVMAKEFPGISIVGEQYSMADRAKGMAATENILTAHPDQCRRHSTRQPSRK